MRSALPGPSTVIVSGAQTSTSGSRFGAGVGWASRLGVLPPWARSSYALCQPGDLPKTMKHTVRDVMAPAVIVAKPSDILGGVREVMDAHDIHSLPIVDDDDQLIGMLTSSDLMPGFSATIPVSRIMSTKVYTVTPDTDIATAAQMMRQYRIHHVVVTDGNKVVGVLSSFDLLRLIAEH